MGAPPVWWTLMRQRRRVDMEELHAISLCALAFDGYVYCKHQRFDMSDTVAICRHFDRFIKDPDYEQATDPLRMILFFIQRWWIREGWIDQESHLLNVAREIFLTVAYQRITPRYRHADFYDSWINDGLPHLDETAETIRQRHDSTTYRPYDPEE